MEFEIRTEVDREHSVDPSYIVRYQIFERGRFIGDGVAQYHRLARHNDYRIPPVKKLDGSPLDPEMQERVKTEIDKAAERHISGMKH
ncbi:MAG: hypothetical protein K6T29_09950 [Peptococcaceae bacterium]|nr:hypothetical protein [Peptococcaceae bacterium]